MMRHVLASIATGLILITCVAAYGLGIGDPAPDLKAEMWFNGDPVNPAQANGTNVYVVEFWATWCPPCKKSIPHLNDLHERLADQGVVIIGVTTEAEKVVKPFVEKMNMKYRVAIAPRDEINATWMKNVDGIPHAFVVDTNGVVIWAGHPMDDLDEVLEDVLAGTFDPTKYSREMDENTADLKKLQEMLIEGQLDQALAFVDEKLSAADADTRLYHLKLGLLAQLDRPADVKATYKDMVKRFWDDAEQLNALAWMACTSPPALCDLNTAWEAANRAVALSKREDPAILDTLARVYYCAGRLSEAVAIQTEALERATDENEIKDLKATLSFYKDAQALSEIMSKKE